MLKYVEGVVPMLLHDSGVIFPQKCQRFVFANSPFIMETRN